MVVVTMAVPVKLVIMLVELAVRPSAVWEVFRQAVVQEVMVQQAVEVDITGHLLEETVSAEVEVEVDLILHL